MQKHASLVDLVKTFPTNIFLQNLASIQKRTSTIKLAHLAEKSKNGSISNLSTKLQAAGPAEQALAGVHLEENAARRPDVSRVCADTTCRSRVCGQNDLGDMYAESGQTLLGSFSAVSKPNVASK